MVVHGIGNFVTGFLCVVLVAGVQGRVGLL